MLPKKPPGGTENDPRDTQQHHEDKDELAQTPTDHKDQKQQHSSDMAVEGLLMHETHNKHNLSLFQPPPSSPPGW